MVKTITCAPLQGEYCPIISKPACCSFAPVLVTTAEIFSLLVLEARTKGLTPADVYYGRDQEILVQREVIKLNTLAMRRKMHYDNRNNLNLMS